MKGKILITLAILACMFSASSAQEFSQEYYDPYDINCNCTYLWDSFLFVYTMMGGNLQITTCDLTSYYINSYIYNLCHEVYIFESLPGGGGFAEISDDADEKIGRKSNFKNTDGRKKSAVAQTSFAQTNQPYWEPTCINLLNHLMHDITCFNQGKRDGAGDYCRNTLDPNFFGARFPYATWDQNYDDPTERLEWEDAAETWIWLKYWELGCDF